MVPAVVLQAVAVAGALGPARRRTLCPPLVGDTMVVAGAHGPGQSRGDATQLYYTLQRCNDPANGGMGHPTERIDAAKHAGVVTVVDVASCQLNCLGRDTFDFPGARTVTHLRMGHNPFASLPEELLWNMTSLVDISMANSDELETLPKAFLRPAPQLTTLDIKDSARLGVERLPEELFSGLSSLANIDLSDCGAVKSLPNLDDLTALTTLSMYADGNGGGSFQLNETDSVTKFNRLASLETLMLQGQALVSVPSLAGLTSLTSLWLKSNMITSIETNAFAGAPRLVSLLLGTNQITFVAPGAFDGLAALRVLPADFNPTMANGKPFRSFNGAAMWLHNDPGYFGQAHVVFATPPISFSPNMVKCMWVGPNVSSFDCSTCMLGFETVGPDNATCVMPVFRPHRGWAANYSRLRLQGTDALGSGQKGRTVGVGAAAEASPEAIDVPRLLTGHT